VLILKFSYSAKSFCSKWSNKLSGG
jgi:hypothetical protein